MDEEYISGLGFGGGGFIGKNPLQIPDGSFEVNSNGKGSQYGGLISVLSPGKAFGGGV